MENQPGQPTGVDGATRVHAPGPLPAASVLYTLGGELFETRTYLPDPDGASGLPTGPAETGDPAARYRLLGEIDRGGMGAVFRVRDTDLGRDIAAKVLLESHLDRPEMLVRFVEEAQIAGQLQHPGIVPVYELGAFDGQRPYFTMKLVKGRTLATLLAERADPTQDRPRLLKVFEAMCQAIGYAHSRGVIHRDLKPSNVMVGAFGEVQVMDWGLAKVLRASAPPESGADESPPANASLIRTRRASGVGEAEGTETLAGSVLGTPAYMPPEQALGEVERLDERADVFGLGAILCEMLTGRPPYVGDGNTVLRKAVRADLADAFARLDGCGADPELVQLARRCLSAEPDDRPRDAGVLARELATHLDSVEGRLRQAEVAGAEARARAAEERKRRKLALALAGAVFALVALGAAGWYHLTQQRADRERAEAGRRDDAARQVRDALSRADDLRRQARIENNPAKWAEARALTDRARGLLVELPTDHELTGQTASLTDALNAEEQDRRLVARLEEVWLLRAEFDGQSASQARRRSLREYAPAFAAYGLRTSDPAPAAAEWVRRRSEGTREAIVAGLDAWLSLARQFKAREAEWLLAVLQAADGDDWRKGLRAALARDDKAEVDRLASSDALSRQPPQTVLLLADHFRPRSQDRAIDLLRQAQARFPGDFWVNFALADAVYQKHFTAFSDAVLFEDAVRYFTTALALRPENTHVKTMLGWSLWLRGRKPEGRAALTELRARHPDYFGAHLYLGIMSMSGEPDKDEGAHFHEALRLNPRSGMAHLGLGIIAWADGRYTEAIKSMRRANRLEPSARSYLAEGAYLLCTGRLDEAAAVYERALKFQPELSMATFGYKTAGVLDAHRPEQLLSMCRAALVVRPNEPEFNIMLNRSLCVLCRWEEAIAAGKKAEKVRGGFFPMRLTALCVREAELCRDLEPHLPLYLEGKRTPQDEQELMMLVDLGWFKQQHRGLAQLYSHAFAADTKWTRDVTDEWRFDAARHALMAASGRGDGKDLDDAERARLRTQAIAWLRADLEGWRKLLESGPDDDRELARERLGWWRQDPKLASVRDADKLAKLPADEQKAANELWAGVAAALAASGK